jgi:hypothetical protein
MYRSLTLARLNRAKKFYAMLVWALPIAGQMLIAAVRGRISGEGD